jgi:ATP-dependent helicase/nuclease subunit A
LTSTLDPRRVQDEQARRLIRELLDETLFVEAGAGTGKTRALVDRYVALILAGRRVDEIAAITFTDKAAAELGDRVRGELERRRSAGEGDPGLLQRALNSLDRAQISTIHAFATSVLRSFAAEFGIDPSFQVQDEIAAERRFQERWRSFLEEAERESSAVEAISRALLLGLTTRDLQTLVHELWRQGAIAQVLDATALPAPLVSMPDLPALRDLLIALHPERAPDGDLLRLAVESLIGVLADLVATSGNDRLALLAANAPRLKPATQGRAPNWGGRDAIDFARATTSQVCEALKDALNSQRGEALAQLLPVCLRFVRQESLRRRRDGELIFDDLILLVRNLLRDSRDARQRLRTRFRTLLIDEFQDTDPLQVEIALAFAEDPATSTIEPGRLFLVGDPKQSIYRFRRADMAVYAVTRARLLPDGRDPIELALNRRSRAPVLAFVNDVLQRTMDSSEPSVQPRYRPVHPERGESCRGPDVGSIGGPADRTAKELRRHEAQQVAAYCRASLGQGWEVWDREKERTRPARFSDMAILIPTRAILAPLEGALAAAGVPYRVEGGSLIYATQEVRDLINCLTAIDDPSDDIAVVAAVRSPTFACSDVELAQFRLGGGSFNYLAPALIPPPSEVWQREFRGAGRVQGALLDLRQLHQTRHDGSIAALVQRLVGEHRLVEAGLYDAANRNAFRRARFVIEQARVFEAEQPESLRSFIEWLERRAGDAVLDHEGSGLDDDEDAVRVLTIHAAKGLEFPIVFMAGLGVGPRHDYPVLGIDRRSGAIAVSLGARDRHFGLGPVEEIQRHETAHEEAERDRLLYVAATRARDHLMISLYHHPSYGKYSAARRLVDHGVVEATARLPELPPVQDRRAAPFAGLTVVPSDVGDEDFDRRRATLVQVTKQPLVTSATALARLDAGSVEQNLGEDGDRGPMENEREDDSEPWARGRGGTHRGRAVHAALQVLPWDADDAQREALAQAQAVAEAIPAEAPRVAELLRRALATDAAARARGARRAQREVPFAVVEQGVTVEGFIDLVLETDDGLEIVDWKTDAVPRAAVARRLEGYTLQAGLYVLALEAATGRPVRRVTYVFVDPGVEASPGGPAELAALARAKLAEFATESGR